MEYYDWFEPLTQRLASANISSLYFDFNGHGKSDGKFEEMTADKELQDAMDVLSWTMTKSGTTKVTLLGHSLGGVIAAMTAGRVNLPYVHQTVLLAPAASIRNKCLAGSLWGTSFDPWHLPDTILLKAPENDYLIGKEFIQNFLFMPIYETAAKFKGRTLIIQGIQDIIVPFTYAERFHEVLPNSELQLIPGADHEFTNLGELLTDSISDWLIANEYGAKSNKC